MKTIIKVFLTVVTLIIAIFLIGVLNSSSNSDSVGVLGLIIGAGFIGATVGIWKTKPSEKEDDRLKLDKS